MKSQSESGEERAARLFAEYVARSEPGAEADVEGLCSNHPDLAGELRRLAGDWRRFQSMFAELAPGAVLSEAETLGDSGAVGATAGGKRLSGVLERLLLRAPKESRYRLMGEVARGGMGAIIKVWDEDLRRSLAMKVILGEGTGDGPGSSTPPEARALRRFVEEAQVTGQLDHPGIVPVHELGLDADGRVYFTMRLVQGRDLRGVFDLVHREEDGWTRTRALGVMLKVCEAMAFAHAKGVVHRDLKPANVMVGRFGEVYVMDWGLAKVLGREDPHDLRPDTGSVSTMRTELASERARNPETPLLTMDGTIIGTPAYMAPEQARGQMDRVGRRSDVYSLGAMLYHLLAGEMPYVPRGAKVSGHLVWRWLLDGPPKPLRAVARDVPVELEAICEKAMSRDAGDRYADTMELAEDLRAYLEDRVVRAHRTGAAAELRKWVRRNRPLSASLAALLAIVVGGSLVFGVYQHGVSEENRLHALQLADQKRIAEANEREAQANEALALDALRRVEGARLASLTESLLEQDPELALLLAVEGARRKPGHDANVLLDRSLRAAGLLVEYELHEGLVTQLELGSDGTRLASAGVDGQIGLWRLESGELERALVGSAQPVYDICFDDAGDLLASLERGRRAVAWDLADGRELHHASLLDWPLAVAFQPRNRVLELRNARGYRRAWEVDSGHEVEPLDDAAAGLGPFVSPGGRLVVKVESDRPARVVDARTGTELCELPARAGRPKHVAFSADGRLVATASGSSTTFVFDTSDWSVHAELTSHEQSASFVAFSPDGRWLATASFEVFGLQRSDPSAPTGAALIVWDALSGARHLTITPQRDTDAICAICFDAGSRHVVLAHTRGPLRRHPLEPLRAAPELAPRELWPHERERYGLDVDLAASVDMEARR